MPLHAFALRKEYEGLDPDTTINLVGGDYQVGRAFSDAEDGIVVLDDQDADEAARAQALTDYFAVKRVAVPTPTKKPRNGRNARTERKEG